MGDPEYEGQSGVGQAQGCGLGAGDQPLRTLLEPEVRHGALPPHLKPHYGCLLPGLSLDRVRVRVTELKCVVR